ncbi:MAG TPA: hypothetical protein VID50_05100, partial [Candidatus Eisenbacteria bacterium]
MARITLALLLVAAAAPGGDDRPDRRVEPDLQARINAAIEKGVVYLKSVQEGDGCWPYARSDEQPATDATAGLTALALYALAASRVPADDEAIRKGLRWAHRHQTSYRPGATYATYSASLLVLALTRIDAERHRRRIHALAEDLAGGQLDSDLWTYGLRPSRTGARDREEQAAPGRGDNSNSQFAVLALWA